MVVGAQHVATPTKAYAVVAGTLGIQIETLFKSSVGKEDTSSNLRVGAITNFKSKIGDGFGITNARALSGVRDPMPAFQLLTEDVHFKKSKGAAQIQDIALNESDLE